MFAWPIAWIKYRYQFKAVICVMVQTSNLKYKIVLSCLDADKGPDHYEQTKSTKLVKETKQKDQSPSNGKFV